MKSAVAALNLGQDILTRLDAIAAADGRSRSNQARIFLEAALNADEALRQQFSQVTSGGAAIQRGAGDDSRAILPANVSGRGAARAGLPRQGEAVDDLCYIASCPASPSNFSDGHLQTPGRVDSPTRGGGAPDFSCVSGNLQAGGRLVSVQPGPGAAVDELRAIALCPAAPSNSLLKEHEMTVTDPHAELKADAVRTAAAGIASRLQPKKDPEK